MTYKTHVAFALMTAAPIPFIFDFSIQEIVAFYSMVVIGSLAPDLDEQGSYLSRKLPIFPIIFGLFGITHRGVTHQLISVIVLCFGAVLFNVIAGEKYELYKFFVSGFIIGYIMHLAGDMLTKGGINNFFYPFSKTKAVLLPRKLRFFTGSIQEYIVFSFVSLVVLFEAYLYMPSIVGVF